MKNVCTKLCKGNWKATSRHPLVLCGVHPEVHCDESCEPLQKWRFQAQVKLNWFSCFYSIIFVECKCEDHRCVPKECYSTPSYNKPFYECLHLASDSCTLKRMWIANTRYSWWSWKVGCFFMEVDIGKKAVMTFVVNLRMPWSENS